MPRVPTLTEFQSNVGITQPVAPQQVGAANVPNFGPQQGADMGRAMMQAGGQLSQIAIQNQMDINDAATKKADNAAATGINELLNNPQSGYLNAQGEMAVKSAQTTKEALQKIIDASGENLDNDMQRRMYRDVAQRRAQMAIQQIDAHDSAQTKQWNLTETNSRMVNSRKDAVANWTLWNTGRMLDNGTKESNPFSSAKATMIAEANSMAAMKGFGPDSETAKALRLEQTTILHGDVMNTMLAADKFKDAKAYYEANSQEIDPEKRDEFKKILNTAGVAEESIKLARAMSVLNDGRSLVQQRAELDMMLENGDITAQVHKETMAQLTQLHTISKAEKTEQTATQATSLELSLKGKGGLNAQLSTLDTMFKNNQISAEVRDNTRQRLEHNYQLQKSMQAEGEKAVIGNAVDWFVHHPGANILDFQKSNPGAYNALKSNGHLSGIVSFAKGNKVDNDPAVWADVMTNMQDLKAMTPTDIYNRYRLKLDDQHLDKLYSINAALNGSKDEQHLSIMTNAEMVNDSAVRMAILPATGKPSESQKKSFNDFQSQIDARVSTFEATNLQGKRKANQEELKKILQQVEMDKVYMSRSAWWDKSDVPMMTVKPEEMKKAYVMVNNEEIYLTSIPAGQRALIIPALRSAGLPVTEKNIASYWVRNGKKK